jgi:diphthine-ammonia ligase
MYQTVGHDAIHLYSECMDVPLYRREIKGGSVLQGSDYTVTADDETEDLYMLLKDVLVKKQKSKKKKTKRKKKSV